MVRGIGARGKNCMKKKTVKYTDEPMNQVEIIEDFLPSPAELVLREETVKVTLSLTKESVDFFKNEAKANHSQYQKLIRLLLDQYARQHMKIGNRRGK